MKKFLCSAGTALGLFALVLAGGTAFAVALQSFSRTVQAQTTPPPAQAIYPYRFEGTLATFALQPAGTVNSADQFISGSGVLCTYNQTARSGTSSTTFAIQAKDSASATYTTFLASSAITSNAQATLIVAPGVQTTSLPSGVSAINLVLPRVWRVQTVIGGTGGPAVTGTIGCNVVP